MLKVLNALEIFEAMEIMRLKLIIMTISRKKVLKADTTHTLAHFNQTD